MSEQMMPTDLLKGQTILVTGAGQGNGRAIALGMAAAGARILCADLNADTAADTAQACGADARSFALDISDRDSVLAAAAEIESSCGPIDCLVNNAGILLRGRVEEDPDIEKWKKTFDVNVTGTYSVAMAFLDQLKATRGSIINIGSIQSFVATPNSTAYTASKGAVLQMTKSLSVELARYDIRVNGIAPGVMRTPMTVETLSNEKASAALLNHIPMGRAGEPEELAGPAVFLASRLASYVTGVMLPVDGGYLSV
ncbi:SDR family NAD(P)-dependent oxidoreductase [Martelella sp. FOR1707]